MNETGLALVHISPRGPEKDVMEYRAEQRRVRGAALDRLTELDQVLGLT